MVDRVQSPGITTDTCPYQPPIAPWTKGIWSWLHRSSRRSLVLALSTPSRTRSAPSSRSLPFFLETVSWTAIISTWELIFSSSLLASRAFGLPRLFSLENLCLLRLLSSNTSPSMIISLPMPSLAINSARWPPSPPAPITAMVLLARRSWSSCEIRDLFLSYLCLRFKNQPSFNFSCKDPPEDNPGLQFPLGSLQMAVRFQNPIPTPGKNSRP